MDTPPSTDAGLEVYVLFFLLLTVYVCPDMVRSERARLLVTMHKCHKLCWQMPEYQTCFRSCWVKSYDTCCTRDEVMDCFGLRISILIYLFEIVFIQTFSKCLGFHLNFVCEHILWPAYKWFNALIHLIIFWYISLNWSSQWHGLSFVLCSESNEESNVKRSNATIHVSADLCLYPRRQNTLA